MTDSSPNPNYTELTDDALLALLSTEEDRVPRAAVDEIIARGPRMVHPLTWLAMDPSNWQAEGPAWWAPIHATYLLSAIGGEDAFMGLLVAADHAEAADCEWVLTALPAMFGRQGASIRPYLSERVRDRGRDPMSRATMAECLAATTMSDPSGSDDVFEELGALFHDETHETFKAVLGGVLMDFQREEYRDAVLAHARELSTGVDTAEADVVPYTQADVERAFSADATPDLRSYTADWLAFYSPDEIAGRQAAWAKEDAEADNVDVELGPEEWEPGFVPQVIRPHPKIGRNDPCRCGSGRKYKKCCLEADSMFEDLNLIGP
ncbi:MAG: YecA family protein [Nitrospirota bacterium]